MPEKGNANPPAEKDTEDLWKEFKQNGCAEIKKELIRRYQALVRYTAERMAASLPKSVDVDDLSQEGNFGLTDSKNLLLQLRNVSYLLTFVQSDHYLTINYL